jgi:hypothetical protein
MWPGHIELGTESRIVCHGLADQEHAAIEQWHFDAERTVQAVEDHGLVTLQRVRILAARISRLVHGFC